MNYTRLTGAGLLAVVLFMSACDVDKTEMEQAFVPNEVKNIVSSMGFNSDDIQATNSGYIVEGDIFLSGQDLERIMESKTLRIANDEQYRTFNLVTGLPRVISVSVAADLPAVYSPAMDAALARFNELQLSLRFQRVASGGDIRLIKGKGSATIFSGFPSNGNPFNQIVTTLRSPETLSQGTLTSLLAHEIGHCIGFRHTDYMNRAFSCGTSNINEGAGTSGAILIPGTPSGPDAGSWMLACITNAQEDRPFNANDIIALRALYQ